MGKERLFMMDRAIADLTEFIFLSDAPALSDVIFLPGSRSPETAECAAGLWKAGFAPLLLPSGWHSVAKGVFEGPLTKTELYPGPYAAECDFYADVLCKNGVPDSAILRETKATFTKENAVFSRQVLDRAGITVRRAILCCKSFHARRAWLYYHHAFPEAELLTVPADVEGVTRDTWYRTANGRRKVAGELKRIGEQFADLLPE